MSQDKSLQRLNILDGTLPATTLLVVCKNNEKLFYNNVMKTLFLESGLAPSKTFSRVDI
jgi:hypothetical protein